MKCCSILTVVCFSIGLLMPCVAGAQNPPQIINPEPSAYLYVPPSPAGSESASAGAIHKQFQGWITKNSRFKLEAPVNKQILKWVDEDVANGEHFSIMLGSKVGKTGKSYQLACWGDQFFAFDFTADEARALKLDADAVKQASTGGAPRDQRLPNAAVKIGKVEIDHSDKLDGAQPITGHVNLEKVGSFPEGSHPSLRFSYFMGSTTTMEYSALIEADRAGGRIAFKINAVNGSMGVISTPSYAGPLAIFVDVCAEELPSKSATICSNAVAVLVKVAGKSR